MTQNNDNFFYFDFLKNSKKFRYLNKSKKNDLYRFLVIPNPNKRSIKEKYEFGGENSTIAGELGDKMEQVVRHLYNVEERIRKGIDYNNNTINNDYPKYYNWSRKNASGKPTTQADRINYLRQLKLYAPICIQLLNSIRDVRNGQRHDDESIENISKQVVDQILKDFHDVLAYFYNYYENPKFPEGYFNPQMQLKASTGDLRGTKKQYKNIPLEYKFNPTWHGEKEKPTEEKIQVDTPKKSVEPDEVTSEPKKEEPKNESSTEKSTATDNPKYEHPSFNATNNLDDQKKKIPKINPKRIWTYAKVAIGVGVALLILAGAISTVSGMVHALFPGNSEADTEEVNDDSNSETSTSTSTASSSKSSSKEKFDPAVFQYSLEGYQNTVYENGKETDKVGAPRFSKAASGEESYIVASNLSNHVVVVSRNSRARELAKDKKLFEQTYKKQKKGGASDYIYDADTNEITLKLHDISYSISNAGYIGVDKNLKLSEKGKQKLQNVFNNPRDDNKGIGINKTNSEKVTLTNEDLANTDGNNYRVVYDLHFRVDTTYISWS